MDIKRRKVKVLIVDDSLVFREMLSRALSNDAGIQVVGTASNPYEARDKIIEYEPDVMTLDVEMPKMNGIEFLRKLMPQYPVPTVVVSSASQAAFDALNNGAVDFVNKPDYSNPKNIEIFINELVIKVKIASTANMSGWKAESLQNNVQAGINRDIRYDLIAIGASTGGTEATYNVLTALPKEIPGVVIVQHMPPVFTAMYADRLNKSCAIDVKEAQTGDIVRPGLALLAPGDFQMRLKKCPEGLMVECFKGEKVNGHCPSVDVLFNSVAALTGKTSIGIILTGMGSDGAKGLLAMRNAGARTIGQDQSSCVVYGMPKVAYDIGAVEKQAHLQNIPQILMSLLKNK